MTKLLLSVDKPSNQHSDCPGFSLESNILHAMVRALADRVVAPQLLEINVTVINTDGNYNCKMGEEKAFFQGICVNVCVYYGKSVRKPLLDDIIIFLQQMK